MEIIIILSIIIIVLQIILLTRKSDDVIRPISDMSQSTQNSVKTMGELISTNQKNADEQQQKILSESFNRLENRFKTYESMNEQKMEAIRQTVEKKLTDISEENSKKLEEMRKTVD